MYPKAMVEELGANINDPEYRMMWYCKYGFTEEAKCDEHWVIRLEAYRKLDFTKEAKTDDDRLIREQAKIYFDT